MRHWALQRRAICLISHTGAGVADWKCYTGAAVRRFCRRWGRGRPGGIGRTREKGSSTAGAIRQPWQLQEQATDHMITPRDQAHAVWPTSCLKTQSCCLVGTIPAAPAALCGIVWTSLDISGVSVTAAVTRNNSWIHDVRWRWNHLLPKVWMFYGTQKINVNNDSGSLVLTSATNSSD